MITIDKQDKDMLRIICHYAVMYAIVLIGIYYVCSYARTIDKGADHNAADITIGQMEKQAAGAAGAAQSAGERVDAAGEAISRADQQLSAGQAAAADSAERIDRIQKLAHEYAERNQQLIAELENAEAAAGKGTQ